MSFTQKRIKMILYIMYVKKTKNGIVERTKKVEKYYLYNNDRGPFLLTPPLPYPPPLLI